jgi:hypothetical protein
MEEIKLSEEGSNEEILECIENPFGLNNL